MGFFCWDGLAIVDLSTFNSNENLCQKRPHIVLPAFDFGFFRRVFFSQESIHIQDMGEHERKHVPRRVSRAFLSAKG